MFDALLVHPLFNLLAIIYAYVGDFGVAIIILTVIVRLAIWPLVTRQLHSQKALQELQPELKKIKEKAAGDRTLEGQLTMELYKEREINPFASFLPLLIQLPIFFALFIVLQEIVKGGVIEKIAYDWVAQLPAIADIISGKAEFHPTLFGAIDLTKSSILLAALSGLFQFIQTKQITPKKAPGDQQAQIMTTMMYLFPALTFFIGLSLPSALPLYWATASLVAILQQYLVLKRDVRELEEGTPEPKKVIEGKATEKAPAKSDSSKAPALTPAPNTLSIPPKADAPREVAAAAPRGKRKGKKGKRKG
ncbi:MAG: putative 60 kDa inner rane insertion protein [Candidatus Saccharibacteria bacterium]|jgi:YidC/Oxa1 family membrane protein insertase|nr:putative 60 kDa inner rane insertion protein [Candidatus Saccharibacteria bacterium]